jgi:hypothetical protein
LRGTEKSTAINSPRYIHEPVGIGFDVYRPTGDPFS